MEIVEDFDVESMLKDTLKAANDKKQKLKITNYLLLRRVECPDCGKISLKMFVRRGREIVCPQCGLTGCPSCGNVRYLKIAKRGREFVCPQCKSTFKPKDGPIKIGKPLIRKGSVWKSKNYKLMGKKSLVKRCPECKSIDLRVEKRRGDTLCESCGFVIVEGGIKTKKGSITRRHCIHQGLEKSYSYETNAGNEAKIII